MVLKKIAAFAMVVITCITLSSCGETKNITMDIEALATELKDNITYQDQLEQIEPDMVKMLYDVEEYADNSIVYMGSGATAEEIAVFECKDADAGKKVEEIVKQHVQDQITSFESYVPAEVAKLKEAVVRSGGKYVALCVSDDSAAANKIMDQYFR